MLPVGGGVRGGEGLGVEHLVYVVIVIGAIVGYWWWTSGRHGGDATKVHAGLRPDEELVWLANGYFKLDLETKDVAIALVGMQRVGKAFTLAGTAAGALVLRPRGEDPVRFLPGQLRFVPLEEGVETLVGLSGSPEPADIFEVQVAGGEPFKVLLPRSVATQVNGWSIAA